LGLWLVLLNQNGNDKLLTVGGVFDSGRNIDTLINKDSSTITIQLDRQNMSGLSLVQAPSISRENAVDFEPDYFVHKSEKWPVFPQKLAGLEPSEIAKFKSDLAKL